MNLQDQAEVKGNPHLELRVRVTRGIFHTDKIKNSLLLREKKVFFIKNKLYRTN